MVRRPLLLACAVIGAVLTNEAEDWQPVSLVLALAAVMLAADSVVVWTRSLRFSAGLLAHVPIMALLGPAPAVAIGMASTALESNINRVGRFALMVNLVSVSVVGLVGGLVFEGLGGWFDLDREDAAYAAFVTPVYLALMPLNIALVLGTHDELTPAERRRVVRDSALPAMPLEFASALMAAAVVLAWTFAGLWAIAGLLALMVIAIPLARMLSSSLESDERAAEVARLASDRDRLVVEVLDAEDRERARLAESLHDGPMQRLVAIRQDAAESDAGLAEHLDAAIAETRAIISAYHPASVAALGFESTLRAAVAPFPAAEHVALTVETGLDDRELAQSLLLPLARELVVNAVKHASPTTISVDVARDGHAVVLEINDDGTGIDTRQADRAVQAGHVGLASVRRRVEDAGGHLDIATRPDGGTRCRVVLPASRV
jgi:signal transduction histidine kinase